MAEVGVGGSVKEEADLVAQAAAPNKGELAAAEGDQEAENSE